VSHLSGVKDVVESKGRGVVAKVMMRCPVQMFEGDFSHLGRLGDHLRYVLWCGCSCGKACKGPCSIKGLNDPGSGLPIYIVG